MELQSVWYLNMVGLKKNWRDAPVFMLLLMKNCEEFHKSLDF